MGRKLLIAGVVVVVAVLLVAGMLLRRLVDPEVLRVAVEQQASAALGQPIKVGALDWALSARPRLVLADVQIGSPAAITLKRVEVTTGLRALLSKRIEGAGLVVSGSRIQLPLPFTLGPGGSGSAHAPATLPPADAPAAAAGFVFASVDRISLQDIELVVGQAILRLDLESSLAGDVLKVSRLGLKSARTSIEGAGEFSSLAARTGTFTVTGAPLDLDELLAIASGASGSGATAAGGGAASSTGPATAPMDVRLEIKAPKGRLLGIDFASLDTTLTVTRAAVTLQPFSVGLFGGTLKGQLALGTREGAPHAVVAAGLEGFDVAALAAFGGSPGVMTGTLGGQIDLQATAGAPDVVFRTATGKATLAIRDGTVPGLDLVGPVILAFGKPDAAKPLDRSSRFSSLGGTFTLAAGTLRSENLAMSSRDVDMKGHGTLRVSGAVVDVKANLILSEALSSQAGRDLYKYAREGNRVVVPATVTGSLAKPTVFIDIAAAAGRAIRNVLEDEVKKGLGRLLKK